MRGLPPDKIADVAKERMEKDAPLETRSAWKDSTLADIRKRS